MKKKRFDENNDLIRLTDRRKNSNKKNMNISNEKINLKDKTTEETKTSVNQTHRDEFNNNNIITILRVRPENPYEKRYSNINIIKIESSTSMQLISPIEYNYYIEGTKFINGDRGIEISKTEKYNYEFDHIFDYTAQQSKIYEYSAEFLVRNIFEGFNSTIFAYGAIGSGKSYTMFGTNDKPGIIIRSINQIFTLMKEQKINVDYCLQMSYYKIYNETIIDLLSEENIQNFNQEENINKINLKSNIRKNKKSFFMDITKKNYI
jgi:kinesin family protein 18/19